MRNLKLRYYANIHKRLSTKNYTTPFDNSFTIKMNLFGCSCESLSNLSKRAINDSLGLPNCKINFININRLKLFQ